jgi:hypothetical protein
MAQWSVLGVVLGGSIVTVLCSAAGCGGGTNRSGFNVEAGTGGTGGMDGSDDGSSSGVVVPPGDDANNGFVNTDATFEGGSSGGGDDGGNIVCPAGLQCDVPCPAGQSTSITGTVYDPALLNPIYNIAVYVPQMALQDLPKGVPTGADACQCGALFKSGAVVYTTTDEKGQFTLPNAPVGTNVPLVIQVGKWRHVMNINVTACMNNAQPDKSVALNGTVAAGSQDSMPDIAVSTGHSDTLECLIKRIGVPNSEFVAGTSTAGHVHIYNGGDPTSPWKGPPTGGQPTPELNPMAGAPESDMNLWDSQAHLMPYDILLLSCEGGGTYNANPPVLEQYLNAGGRAFASHYHYQWFTQQAGALPGTPADWANLATWAFGSGGPTSPPAADGVVDQTLNTAAGGPFPKGVSLEKWLGNVGGLATAAMPIPNAMTGDVPIYQAKWNAVVTPTNTASQPWLTMQNPGGAAGPVTETMYFSFDTPVNAQPVDGGPPQYCGRGVYSDLHVDGDPTSASNNDTCNASMVTNPGCGTNANPCMYMPDGMPPPAGCASGPLSPQEKVLEFMLFDLSSCVISDRMPPPKTIPVVY